MVRKLSLSSEQLKELEVAALSMGYRRLRADKLSWAKPFSHSLLCIDGEKEIPEIFQVFRSAKDGSICFYSHDDLHLGNEEEYGSVVDQIKWYEAYSVKTAFGHKGDFHFLKIGIELETLGLL